MSRKWKRGSRRQRFTVEKDRRGRECPVPDCGSLITGTSFTTSLELDLKRNIVQTLPRIFLIRAPAPLPEVGLRLLHDVGRCLLCVSLHVLEICPHLLDGLASHLLDQLPSVFVTNRIELLLLLRIQERS